MAEKILQAELEADLAPEFAGGEGAFGASLGEEIARARKPKKQKHSKVERRENLIAFLFILPPIIGFLIFTAISVGCTIIFSFQNYFARRGESEWVGFIHYLNLFKGMGTAGTLANSFFKSVGNTIFLLLSIPISMIFGLGLAALLRMGEIKGGRVLQVIYYLPAVSSAVALNIVWRYIFQSNGILNTAFGTSTPWLSDDMLVKVAIILKNSLNGMGGAMILYLAGMLNVSKDLYEASSLDGAGKIRQFFSITLPIISPVTFYLLITGLIGGLQSYVDAQVFAKGGSGSHTIVYFIWQQRTNGATGYGVASAAAVLLSICIMIVTLVQFKFSNKWVYED